MHMRVTLRLANHKRIARMPPSKTTSKPQPGLYPNNSSDCHLPIHPTLCSGPPPPCTPFQKVAPSPGALPPPRPSLESWGHEEPALDFREGLPVPSQRHRDTQARDPSLLIVSKNISKGQSWERKRRPGTRAALSSPVPSVFLLQ